MFLFNPFLFLWFYPDSGIIGRLQSVQSGYSSDSYHVRYVMNYYIVAYTVSIILSIVCGGLIFQKYRNLSGLFFFLFTFFASSWFFLYFLFFSGINDVPTLLFLSRLDFWVWLGATYSLLFFVYFFDTKVSSIWSPKLIWIGLVYALILWIHAFTDRIVGGLTYVAAENVYREIQWTWYPLNGILHLGGVVLLVWVASWQIKKQTYLNKIRLTRVVYSAYTFMVSCLILQLVLPTFGIWILEKEIIFLFAAFILYAFFTIRRYYFSSLWYGVGKTVVTLVSIVLSVAIVNLIKFVYINIKTGVINNYWMLQDQYSVIDTIGWVIIFYVLYTYLQKLFLWNAKVTELRESIQKLGQSIAHATSLQELNTYLGNEIKRIFKTKCSEIRIFDTISKKTELQKYFENDLSDKIFINDIVFIEEKKTKFNKERLLREIPEEAFLILPLFDNNQENNVGVLIIGVKSFGDFYTIDEIDALRGLIPTLELHLKYIETYRQIQDLSVNLDKKVDEKTIEYNNLINQQKEFISVISHEIKSPIATAIFQADSMLDDMDQDGLSKEDVKNELQWLSSQLIKTGELISRIFSVQYFDTHNVTLFKEKVQISHLLETEYEVYSRMHEHIRFEKRIDSKMWFVEIDRIQFQQVLSNLLNNAIKFIGQEDPVIAMEAYKKQGWLILSIEDNGKWFEWIDIGRLFEKYSTGSSESAWLGMWLYLCKKIIDMHKGEITASISENLGWAKFTIKIPAH